MYSVGANKAGQCGVRNSTNVVNFRKCVGLENETIIQVRIYTISCIVYICIVHVTQSYTCTLLIHRFRVEKTFRWHCRTRVMSIRREVRNLVNWAMAIQENTLSRQESRDLPIAMYSPNEMSIVMFQVKCTCRNEWWK